MRQAAVPVTIVLVIMVLPVLYILSAGPIVWLDGRGVINLGDGSLIWNIYIPLEWAAEKFPPVAWALEGYISLWEPAQSLPLPPPVGMPMPAMPVPIAAPTAGY